MTMFPTLLDMFRINQLWWQRPAVAVLLIQTNLVKHLTICMNGVEGMRCCIYAGVTRRHAFLLLVLCTLLCSCLELLHWYKLCRI